MEVPTNHQLSSVINSISEAEEDVVETDPSGRFERYRKSLGKGAYKEVYKAFDQEEGVEVAWNQIKFSNLSAPDINRIHTEIQILQSLRNENIINLLYSWRAPSSVPDRDDIFFITEFMSSGSLKGYIKKTKGAIKPKIVRNWCKQILNGLCYLHTRDHPIIHRDLKCENIFINGNNGQAKIGDLGLAVVKATQHLSSVLGTPEFMAPELYDENYDEKVDIYAFGMVVLEIATKEYPYSECSNQAQIYRKVTTGVKPAALGQVTDPEIHAFIDLCIEHDPKKRPNAVELLNHPFFYSSTIQPSGGSSVDLTALEMANSTSSGSPAFASPAMNVPVSQSTPRAAASHIDQVSNTGSSPPRERLASHLSQQTTETQTTPHQKKEQLLAVQGDDHNFYISRQETPLKPSVTCDVEAVGPVDQDEVELKMVYHTGTSSCEIKFPFNLTNDTATDVVSELVKENLIQAIDEQLTRRRIEEAIRGVLIRQRQNQTSSAASSEESLSKNENTLVGGLNIPTTNPETPLIPNASPVAPVASSSVISGSELVSLMNVPIETVSLVNPYPGLSTIPPPVYRSTSPVKRQEVGQQRSSSTSSIPPSNNSSQAASNRSSVSDSEKQKEISQKLTELMEGNLKVFDDGAKAGGHGHKPASNGSIHLQQQSSSSFKSSDTSFDGTNK